MLNVKTPEEVLELIGREFREMTSVEETELLQAYGRILGKDIHAQEYVPDFNRSTVDGYAVKASDTFGCSDSLPALLELRGRVLMGEQASQVVEAGYCVAVPTGGEVPEGADAVVMLEYTEDYGEGTIGILKSAAPGMNMVYRGDDVKPGKTVLKKGKVIETQDIGAMAAMGISTVPVMKKLRVGIISTGDELIPAQEIPKKGQIRDINSSLLAAMMREAGADPVLYGIVRDETELLEKAVREAVQSCDVVLISGGSSVGEKDATCQIIEKLGEILFHGIAMKPGKPTILGRVEEVPIFGLPGHPAAAMFVTKLFVIPLLDQLTGCTRKVYPVKAILEEAVGANHGRAQYNGVLLSEENGVIYAKPVRSKSGLITSLAGVAGYFGIERDCEGLAAGTEIMVHSFKE